MGEAGTVKILIADDHYVVRIGLAAVLKYEPLFAVVAVAEDGEQAIALARTHAPDIILMDVRMPGLGGIEATRRVRAEFPAARVLMLSATADPPDVAAALAAGAAGFVLKTAGLADLRAAITTALTGRLYLSPEVATPDPAAAPPAPLSARHREVLDLLAAGLSNKEIAKALGLTVDGAKARLKGVFARLGVRDRTEAVVAAINLRLIRIPG